MTKWQLIKFADVKVGDTIKSVSPCGTVRRGVVTERYETWASDVSGAALIEDDYALYRRAPKFTPLDVPAVGQWGEFTLRDGQVLTFQVTDVEECTEGAPHHAVAGGRRHTCINRNPGDYQYSSDIVAWSPTTPPAPEEPTGFGYVGFVEGYGDTWDLTIRGGMWTSRFTLVRRGDGVWWQFSTWPHVLSLGTFTAATR